MAPFLKKYNCSGYLLLVKNGHIFILASDHSDQHQAEYDRLSLTGVDEDFAPGIKY